MSLDWLPKKTQGITLVELLISVAIASVLGVVAIEASRRSNLSQIYNERTMQTASQARQFFDIRGKVFRNGSTATLGSLMAPANTFFQSVSVDSSSAGGAFTEQLSNVCSRIVRPVDFNLSLSTAEQNLLSACLPACADNVPKVRITRGAMVQDFPDGNGTGIDGNPIGAALCIRANGTAADFRDVNLQLLMLTRTGDNKVKMTPYEATFPRPKQQSNNSIKVLGTVRE